MPPPFVIPGYYWDERLQKFFKIEKTGTAPAGAFWSRENAGHAERRQKQQQQQQQQQQQRRKRRRRTHERDGNDSNDRDKDDNAYPRRVQRSGLDDCCFFACAAGGQPPQRAAASATVSDGRRFGASAASLATGVLGNSLTAAGAAAVLEEVGDQQDDGDNDDDNDGDMPDARRLVFREALGRPKRLATGTAVSCLYVHGADGEYDDPNRLGIVYTNYCSATNPGDIKGQYLVTDENGCIPPSWPTEGRFAAYAGFARTRPEGLPVPDASAICYHAATHRLLVTSRQLAWPSGACMHIYKPHDLADLAGPFPALPWGVGRARRRFGGGGTDPSPDVVQICGSSEADAVYACAVAPPSAPSALCVIGTYRGLVLLDRDTLTLQSIQAGRGGRGSHLRRPPHPLFNERRGNVVPMQQSLQLLRALRQPEPSPSSRNSGSTSSAGPGGLVTSVDFLDNHPQLVVMGTRCPEPWLVDLREPPGSRGHRFGGGGGRRGADGDDDADRNSSNAVAHVRSVGGYGVVAAGLRNSMLLYDVRFMKPRRSTTTTTTTAALFRFADYHNEARLIGLGFAVDASLGLVAVGEEHAGPTRLGGGVAVFSLATGERLATPGLVADRPVFVDGVDAGTRTGISHAAQTIVQAYDPLAAAGPAPPPPSPLPRVQALSFASLPGEGPSLFAGVGPFVHKYLVGAQGEDVF